MEVKKYIPSKYILSYHSRRKNYRRKIAGRFLTEDDCVNYWLTHYNEKVDYEIYTYDWKFVRKLNIYDLEVTDNEG